MLNASARAASMAWVAAYTYPASQPPTGLVHHYNIRRTIWSPRLASLLNQSFVCADSLQMKFPQHLQRGAQPSHTSPTQGAGCS